HHVGPQGLELGADGGDGRLLPLGDVVVAADDGADDAPGVAERGLERAPRPHRLGTHRDPDVGALLATDPGKELVQVVGNTQGLAHTFLLAATPRGRGSFTTPVRPPSRRRRRARRRRSRTRPRRTGGRAPHWRSPRAGRCVPAAPSRRRGGAPGPPGPSPPSTSDRAAPRRRGAWA